MRLLSKICVCAIASVSSSCATLVDWVPHDVDSFVRSEMARQQVPGVALAVVKGGRVVKSAGYGLANVELNVPVTASSIFQSGSVGKQFTAVAVMMQVEDGRLGLDDSIAAFFPGAPDSWKKIHRPSSADAHVRHTGPYGRHIRPAT